MYTCTHTHTHTHTNTHTYTLVPHACAHMHAYTHTQTHNTGSHVFIYINMFVPVLAHPHTCTCVHCGVVYCIGANFHVTLLS